MGKSKNKTGQTLEGRCAQLIIQDLPSLVCYLKQNFCDPELRGLTLQQHRVMALLTKGGRSTTQIADELGVSLPAISRMTQNLFKSGWLKKEISKEDKRQSILTLTKLGQEVISKSQTQSMGQLVPRLDQLSTKEKNTLIEAFEILNKLNQEE